MGAQVKPINVRAAVSWPLRTACLVLHRWYLGILIRAAEKDVRYMEGEIQHASKLPAQIASYRRHISDLRVRRIVL